METSVLKYFANRLLPRRGEVPLVAIPTRGVPALCDELVPIRRPHFELREGGLFFLVSRRPHAELDGQEQALWSAIDGTASFGVLRQSFPGLDALVSRFWTLGVVELAETSFRNDRGRILVVEPHMDDAVLSVGGLMWQRRHEAEFCVLAVASESNFTSYHKMDRPYYDVAAVSALRRAESDTVMRLLGGRMDVLGAFDAPLRYYDGEWTLDWFLANRSAMATYVNHSAPPEAVDRMAQQLAERFAASDAQELWIPMGIGISADHETTRNACLAALQSNPDLFARFDVYLYQDTPYVIDYPDHAARIVAALGQAGARLEPTCADIGGALPDKLRLLAIFGSQFKPSYMDPKTVAAAQQSGASSGMEQGEIRYRLRSLPKGPLQAALYSGRPKVEAIVRKLQRWYPRNRAARRIRILIPTGVGCWQDDMGFLLEAFPCAVFEVHLAAGAKGEAGRLDSPRLDVRIVGSSARDWAKRIARVLVSSPRPLIVVTGNKLWQAAPLVRIGLFPFRPLAVSTIDHLVAALRSLRNP